MNDRMHRAGATALCLCFLALGPSACGSDEPVAVGGTSKLAAAEHRSGSNQAPEIRALQIEPNQPNISDRVRAVASVRDAEGDPVTLTFEWSIDDETRRESGPEIDLAGVETGSSIAVSVVASDGKAQSPPFTAQAWVIDRPPVMNGIAIEPTKTVYPGDMVVVTPTATDPDGDMVDFRFEWYVNDEQRSEDGRSFSSEGLRQGDRIRVRVMAQDRSNESRPLESADVIVGSAHPEIVSNPPGVTDAGVFRYAVQARDPDGDKSLRFALTASPDGMKIDEVLGVIEWRPGEKQVGTHPVTVLVRDSSRLETRQSFEVTVSDTPPAAPEPAAK